MGRGHDIMRHVFCYGLGYTAQALARIIGTQPDVKISGTTRSSEHAQLNATRGIDSVIPLDTSDSDQRVAQCLLHATHLLVSAAPDALGDPMLDRFKTALQAFKHLTWVGYLSTIGVYGDQANAWVDEDTPCNPKSPRAINRIKAEREWLDWGASANVQVQVFRLSGIYGPRRSVLEKLKAGTARRIEKPGQVFNRIHVDDIARVLDAAMHGNGSHNIYNVTDNEPAPPQDVVAYGANLLGIPPPPLIPIEQANLSAMGRSFYSERRRVRNDRITSDLGLKLDYPTYREGLTAILNSSSDARIS